MNQNVFGMILFTFIVGTAIFVSEFFVKLPTPPAVFERPATVNKYSCSHQRRTVYVSETTPVGNASIKVTQAVLNQQTNQLTTDFSIKRETPNTSAVGIALHFFVKNGVTTKYWATETITVTPDFDENGKAIDDVSKSFKWIGDLNLGDNLYVMAEPSLNFNRSRSIKPTFDATNATPVLLKR
jgi:hypothetical protein